MKKCRSALCGIIEPIPAISFSVLNDWDKSTRIDLRWNVFVQGLRCWRSPDGASSVCDFFDGSQWIWRKSAVNVGERFMAFSRIQQSRETAEVWQMNQLNNIEVKKELLIRQFKSDIFILFK